MGGMGGAGGMGGPAGVGGPSGLGAPGTGRMGMGGVGMGGPTGQMGGGIGQTRGAPPGGKMMGNSGESLPEMQARLKEMKGEISYLDTVKPAPDSTERRHSETGDYPPFFVDGRKAVIVAAASKNEGMLNWTLAQGVDINDRDENGRSLFAILSILGVSDDILEDFLRRGADPRLVDQQLRTPVHLAVSAKKMAVLEFLLDRLKLEVDALDDEKNTPLLYAVATGQPVMVKRLLEKWGANVHSKNILDRNSVHLVCSHNDLTEKMSVFILGELLRNKIDVTLQSQSDGNTPLHLCAMNGHEPLIKAIIAHVPNTAVPNSRGYTPAMVALMSSQSAVADLLYRKNMKAVKEWNESELGEYILFEITSLPLVARVDLLQRFYVYRIDGAHFINISDDILQEMGINAPNTRAHLMEIFQDLILNGPRKAKPANVGLNVEDAEEEEIKFNQEVLRGAPRRDEL